jgi:hypothetical protein
MGIYAENIMGWTKIFPDGKLPDIVMDSLIDEFIDR